MIKIVAFFAGLFGLIFVVLTFETPQVEAVQRGYRGTGMVQLFHKNTHARLAAANQAPEALPPEENAGTKSSEVYQNVKVLGDVDANQFLRLMNAMTNWVAPEQGCTYCHNAENLADDSLYTKVVARRMLQMTRKINGAWGNHVGATGVTCYTCHRGQPVPAEKWFHVNDEARSTGMAQRPLSKNIASRDVGQSSLPHDLALYLEQANDIRIAGQTALPAGNRHSIEQGESSYGLMMHFSQSLGVNCTYCHNSRSFGDWSQSTPQRTTAWYGIRMVRDINNTYLNSLQGVFPAERLGPMGDVAKVACATCHQGVYKPLYGTNMVDAHPELKVFAEKTAEAASGMAGGAKAP